MSITSTIGADIKFYDSYDGMCDSLLPTSSNQTNRFKDVDCKPLL